MPLVALRVAPCREFRALAASLGTRCVTEIEAPPIVSPGGSIRSYLVAKQLILMGMTISKFVELKPENCWRQVAIA